MNEIVWYKKITDTSFPCIGTNVCIYCRNNTLHVARKQYWIKLNMADPERGGGWGLQFLPWHFKYINMYKNKKLKTKPEKKPVKKEWLFYVCVYNWHSGPHNSSPTPPPLPPFSLSLFFLSEKPINPHLTAFFNYYIWMLE